MRNHEGGGYKMVQRLQRRVFNYKLDRRVKELLKCRGGRASESTLGSQECPGKGLDSKSILEPPRGVKTP